MPPSAACIDIDILPSPPSPSCLLQVSLFETNIRVLGGLLSAHVLAAGTLAGAEHFAVTGQRTEPAERTEPADDLPPHLPAYLPAYVAERCREGKQTLTACLADHLITAGCSCTHTSVLPRGCTAGYRGELLRLAVGGSMDRTVGASRQLPIIKSQIIHAFGSGPSLLLQSV